MAKYLSTLVLLLSVYLTNAQECNVIYVTPAGASTGAAGTKANPANLTYGFSLATAANNRIKIAAGTYIISAALAIPANTQIEGGFNATNWRKSNGTATTIIRDNSNVTPNPSRLVGLFAINTTNFRLQDLTIRVLNAFTEGTSCYTVHLSGCSNYQLVRCRFIGGNAGSGFNGTNGANGLSGVIGLNGLGGDENGSCCTSGGAAPASSFPGSFVGGAGGTGGARGTYEFPDGGTTNNGTAGQPGQGPGGGGQGNGGVGVYTTIISTSCDRTLSNDGTQGINGVDGLPGLAGNDGTTAFTGGFFIPGNGLPGAPGQNGNGGGGGGGGGAQGGLAHDIAFGFPPNTNGSGAGGGSGGEGGQGATGGVGGTGGGSSFCLYLHNNGASTVIKDCQFTIGAFGFGGVGGQGGIGGSGGLGGQGGGAFNCDTGAGGDGGRGGKGGDGGVGGRGADGIAQTLYEDGGTPIQQLNIYSLQQPTIRVLYSGCTNVPVQFSTTATGTVQWFFGAGATPATSVGQSAVCSYTTTGRKTFTMVNNAVPYTFTDFIEIFDNQAATLPTIQSSDDTLCEGQTGTFSSSITADDYFWKITGDNNYLDSLQGSTLQILSSYAFPAPGNYQIVHSTVNTCCGRSFPDTFNVFIEDILTPTITTQVSTDTICQNAIVVFTADADSVGTNPTYQWFLNGAPVGSNSAAYSLSNIATGDAVTCTVTSALGCGSGLQATSTPLSVFVIPPPQLTCSADSFISLEPTLFETTVVSGGIAPFTYVWDFGDDTQGEGDQVSHIYVEPGPYTINVEATDGNGCQNSCTFVINIISVLAANYTADLTGGCAPITVNFTNQSTNAITYLWNFGDGNTSTQESPSHTYQIPGTYDVTLSAFGIAGNVNTTTPNQVAVFPPPVANFFAFPINLNEGGDSIQFSDNSFDATQWLWNFGDNSPTDTTPSPLHVYANNGSYTVSLVVTNNFGCTDSITYTNVVTVNVGTTESLANQGILIFPNPTSATLNIKTTNLLANQTYTLYNSIGQQLYTQTPANSGTTILDLSPYPVGIYTLQITTPNQPISVVKVVKE